MRILILPGDGIGPEIVEAGVGVLSAVNASSNLGLHLDNDVVGFASLEKYGTTLRDGLLDKARSYDGIILGPQSNMDYPPVALGGRGISAAFRVQLDLYANVRPARSRPFLPTYKPMDLVFMREATEGFYPDRNMYEGQGEFMPTPDTALSMRKITAFACERIARRAFELAVKRRKKVTAVTKVNVLKLTDGLFLDQVRKVAAEFPDVEVEEVLVDAMAALLVRQPEHYDVIVTTNFYGDILSDLASELSGGLGLAGSIMAGDSLCAAQAQHGSAPDIAGQDKANPSSMILSIAMLLKWMGDYHHKPEFRAAGDRIDLAVDKILENPATRTADLGGALGTKAFGQKVAELVSNA